MLFSLPARGSFYGRSSSFSYISFMVFVNIARFCFSDPVKYKRFLWNKNIRLRYKKLSKELILFTQLTV